MINCICEKLKRIEFFICLCLKLKAIKRAKNIRKNKSKTPPCLKNNSFEEELNYKYYTLLLLTTVAFSQPKSEKKAEQVALKPSFSISTPAIHNTSIKSDTIKVSNLSTAGSNIPIDATKNTRVVIVKDISKEDYSKYFISLISLLIGFFLNRFYEWWNNKKKVARSGKRWIIELSSLEESIEKQIEALKTLDELLKKDGNAVPNLAVYSILEGEVFKSLSKDDLVNYIQSKNSKPFYKAPFFQSKKEKLDALKYIIKISNRVNGFITRMKSYYEQIAIRHTSFSTEKSAHTTALSKNLQRWMKSFADYGVQLEKDETSNHLEHPQYKPIADLFLSEIVPHIPDGNFNPDKLKNDFFIPVVKILAAFRNDPRIANIAAIATDCLNDIAAINMELHYIDVNLNKIILHFKELLEDLNPLINDIDGIK